MLLLVPILLAALFTGGCLGTLPHDAAAEQIVRAPAAVLALPLHESDRHWLLRGADGWCGAHEVRLGGDPADPAVATIRAVRFEDSADAQRAFARLTPAYLFRVLRDRMVWAPRPRAFPVAARGDEMQVMDYGVRLPPDIPPEFTLAGQLVALRVGSVVLLVETIGVWPEQLGEALDALVGAATTFGRSDC